MKHSKEFKYRYDEQEGIFVRKSEISVNWLLRQILADDHLQITKINNNQLHIFLKVLNESDLRMHEGEHAIVWLKNQLTEKRNMTKHKLGEKWEIISNKYQFIVEQIDLLLINCDDYEEKMKIIKEPEIKRTKTPNRIKAYFEPLEEKNK